VECAFLLNVVVSHRPPVLQALSREDESLLVTRNTFLVLNLSLDVLNAVSLIGLNSHGLSGKCPHENLHASSQSQHEVQGALLLDVVVGHCPSIFETLSGEDESLFAGWDALLLSNTFLDLGNAVGVLHIDSHGLPSESSHEYLHSSAESEDEVDGAFLLDVIVTQAAFILELLAPEDESLLVHGDALPRMDELLEAGHAVTALHLACHGLSC
jgi:hypothetical protein